MKIAKIVVGAIVLLVGIWLIITLENTTSRYLGGGIVSIIGLGLLINGILWDKLKAKKEGAPEQKAPESAPETSEAPAETTEETPAEATDSTEEEAKQE